LDFMFRGFSKLREAPLLLNTSAVYSMANMFQGCYSLETVHEMNTSSVTNMANMFFDCEELRSLPDIDARKVDNTAFMFRGCKALWDGKVRLIRPDGTKPANRAHM
ncbi:BspA family leucine-rich repeat surface protein, partial [Lactobacillus crispatus]|uniref:BspA family leucine-rich repeat surface protein n=1 Tax=Lactobacillus crispatus TaxID=47770 RepID=UPI00254A6B70